MARGHVDENGRTRGRERAQAGLSTPTGSPPPRPRLVRGRCSTQGAAGPLRDQARLLPHRHGFANQGLAGNPDAVVVPVCYAASAGPWQAGSGTIPGIGAPSYDDSERQGYDNLLAKVESTHKADPHARYTIVGYSQGAQ